MGAIALVMVVGNTAEWGYMGGWLLSFIVVQVARQTVISSFWRTNPQQDDVIPWGSWYSVTATLSALVLGAGRPLPFFPRIPSHIRSFLALFLCGMSTVSAIAYSPMKETYVPTILAGLLPVSFWYMSRGTQVPVLLGLGMLTFCVFLLLLARHLHNLHRDSLLLKSEKETLVDKLSQETNVTVTLNQRLREEILEHAQTKKQLETANDRLEKILSERTTELSNAVEALAVEVKDRGRSQLSLQREKDNLVNVLEGDGRRSPHCGQRLQTSRMSIPPSGGILARTRDSSVMSIFTN